MSGKDKRIEESMMQENQISPLPPKKEDSERRTRWPSHNCLLSKTEGAARCAQEGRYSMSRGEGVELRRKQNRIEAAAADAADRSVIQYGISAGKSLQLQQRQPKGKEAARERE